MPHCNETFIEDTPACVRADSPPLMPFSLQVAVEALIDPSPSPTASVALHRYESASSGRQCLSSKPPGPDFNLENASAPPEGWCSPRATNTYTQAIVLWYSKQHDDYRTCGGGLGCNATDMRAAGYEEADGGQVCFARSSADPKDMPCKYGLPSIYRSDSSFWDQIYW